VYCKDAGGGVGPLFVAKVRIAGSNPVVRSKKVQVVDGARGRNGPLVARLRARRTTFAPHTTSWCFSVGLLGVFRGWAVDPYLCVSGSSDPSVSPGKPRAGGRCSTPLAPTRSVGERAASTHKPRQWAAHSPRTRRRGPGQNPMTRPGFPRASPGFPGRITSPLLLSTTHRFARGRESGPPAVVLILCPQLLRVPIQPGCPFQSQPDCAV